MNKFKYSVIILVIFLVLASIYGWFRVYILVNEFEINISRQDSLESLEDSEENFEIYSELCLQVASDYAKYISGAIEFKDIKNYFTKDTQTYNNLKGFNNNHFTEFDSSQILNEEIIDIKYESNKILCEIKFDYIIYIDNEQFIYESHYELEFNQNTNLVETIVMK